LVPSVAHVAAQELWVSGAQIDDDQAIDAFAESFVDVEAE
jgi:hypothetical protein